MKSRQYRRYHRSTLHDQQSGTVTQNTAECNHSFYIMFLMNQTHSTTSQPAVNAVKMFPTVNWTRVHELYEIRRQIPWSRRLDSNHCGKHISFCLNSLLLWLRLGTNIKPVSQSSG